MLFKMSFSDAKAPTMMNVQDLYLYNRVLAQTLKFNFKSRGWFLSVENSIRVRIAYILD